MEKLKHETFIEIRLKNPGYLTEFFADIQTFKQLVKKIDKHSETDYQLFNLDGPEKFKGDIFEIFTEIFFKLYSSHNKIGVYDYQPVPDVLDNGVDGIGVGNDEKPIAIQAKYKSNVTAVLTSKDLKQFPYHAIVKYKVEPTGNLILFTSGKGLHWHSENEVFQGTIKTIGYQAISSFIDNNTVFWKNCLNLIRKPLIYNL